MGGILYFYEKKAVLHQGWRHERVLSHPSLKGYKTIDYP